MLLRFAVVAFLLIVALAAANEIAEYQSEISNDEEPPVLVDHNFYEAEEERMKCIVCRSAIAPVLAKAIRQTTDYNTAQKVVEDTLEPLSRTHTYDLVTKSVVSSELGSEAPPESQADQEIHEYVQHLLWDAESSRALYGLVITYHQFPDRRHGFDRLVDHTVCPCHDGKDVEENDEAFHEYLMNHVTATHTAFDIYGGHDSHDIYKHGQTAQEVEERGDSGEEGTHETSHIAYGSEGGEF